MNRKSMTKAENLQTDLVVIGGGGAGLAAAVAAAESGCRNIIILEKAGSPGGSTAMAHDVFAAESPVQIRNGQDARMDDFFKIAMNWAHWSKINPRIVRAFIDKSGDTIRWLEEKGVSFELTQFYPNQVPRVRHTVQGPGQAAELIRILRKECENLGIQVLTRTRGRKILREEKGRIDGVLAQTQDGKIAITTGGVIIASGGYGNNRAMLKKYCPSYYYAEGMEYDGVPGNTGDGLLMAVEIGAATAGLGSLMILGPHVHKSARLAAQMTIGTGNKLIQMSLAMVLYEPETLWVNKRGRRFIDEGHNLSPFASGNAVAQQPDAACYSLFDSRILQMMEEKGLIRQGAVVNQTVQLYRGIPQAGEPVPGLAKGVREKAKEGTMVKMSDSWDEIATWIGAKPEVLKATIDEYNTDCDHAHDSIFVKDRRYLLPLRTPPYYAIRGNARICDAIGGVKINEKMEVLDGDDNAIPGLYAAGSVSGCWESESYCYHLTGHLVGFALNSGRIAGENAAVYVSR
jgi:fumarate reductase flavoprotein subunit